MCTPYGLSEGRIFGTVSKAEKRILIGSLNETASERVPFLCAKTNLIVFEVEGIRGIR